MCSGRRSSFPQQHVSPQQTLQTEQPWLRELRAWVCSTSILTAGVATIELFSRISTAGLPDPPLFLTGIVIIAIGVWLINLVEPYFKEITTEVAGPIRQLATGLCQLMATLAQVAVSAITLIFHLTGS